MTIRPYHVCCICFFATAIAIAGPAPRSAETERAALAVRFRPVLEKTHAMILDGRVDEAAKVLEDAAPEAHRTPWEDLYLGDVLYSLSPQRSAALHERAYAALPDVPEVALETALERHRAGKCAEALPLYRAVLRARPAEQPLNALVAECLLRAGDAKGAAEAWEAAGHASHHTGIDFTIFAVHGEASPWRRRADLLASAREGDRAAIVKALTLDLRFDQDWWNVDIQADALARDRAEFMQLLGEKSSEWSEIDAWLRLAEAAGAEQGRAALEAAKLLLAPAGTLPKRDEVTLEIVARALSLRLADGADLLARFGKQLQARAFAEPGNAAAADTLLGLMAETNSAEAANLERQAWEKFHQPRFAGAHLALLEQADSLRTNSEALQAARREFPLDARIAGTAFACAQRERKQGAELLPYLEAAILAEYAHPSGMYAANDSYRLKAYFGLLAGIVGTSGASGQ